MNKPDHRVSRTSRLGWVRMGEIKTSPHAQREYSETRARRIAAKLDLEAIGFIVVSKRDGQHYCVDGQHRLAALLIFGFSPDDVVQCEIYDNITEEEEAELFLQRDDRTAVRAFDKFKIARFAGRHDEVEVDRMVRANHLIISKGREPGAIACVTTLLKVYRRSGDVVLGRALRVTRDAWGDGAYERDIIDGLGLVLHRYGDKIDETEAVERLRVRAGGSIGVLNDAKKLSLSTGSTRAHCVASVIVETLNRRRKGSTRLSSWWKP